MDVAASVVGLLSHFSLLATLGVDCRALGSCDALAVLNHGRLLHAGASAAHSRTHLHRAEARTPEKVVIVKAAETSEAPESAHPRFLLGAFLLRASASKTTEAAEASSKKVVIISEKSSERILATKRFPKDFICISKRKPAARASLEPTKAAKVPKPRAEIVSASSRALPLKSFFSISVVHLPLVCIRKASVGLSDLLEGLFSLLLVVRVLVGVPLDCEFAVGLFDSGLVSVPCHTKHGVVIV